MTVWQHVRMQDSDGDEGIEVFDNLQPAERGSTARDDAHTGDTTINIAPFARITFSVDPHTGECVARVQYRPNQPAPMISLQGHMASDLYRELQRRLAPAPFHRSGEPGE